MSFENIAWLRFRYDECKATCYTDIVVVEREPEEGTPRFRIQIFFKEAVAFEVQLPTREWLVRRDIDHIRSYN